MQKLQFFHDVEENFTVALEVPDIKDIKNCLFNEHSIVIKTGLAYCHHVDQYNKKIGREVSVSKIEKLNFYISNIKLVSDHVLVYLRNDLLDSTLQIVLKTKLNKESFYFVNAELF